MLQDRWHIPTSEEEIVGVFVQETEDLANHIAIHLKLLTRDHEDRKALTEIRRCFHTIKGSGRMVKALDISELAWKVENALNQAIVGSVPVTESLVRLITTARAQLPRLVTAFKQRRSIARTTEIERLMRLADDLAEGKAPALAAVTALPTRQQSPTGLNDINVRLDRCMQRADEALHRSELALQQSRRTSDLVETASLSHGRRDWAAEVERLERLVQALSSEVSDLRRESQRPAAEPALSWTDVNRLIDARTRSALSTARLRSQVTQPTTERGRRRFGWQSLLFSALIGGLVAIGLLFAAFPSAQEGAARLSISQLLQ